MDGRVPSYDWRGLGQPSRWTDGTPADCSVTSGPCTRIDWPAGAGVYYKRPPPGPGNNGPLPTWVGSLLANGEDGTGLLYRRNRYYDPASGRFTQEDPIGLAGGVNLYGFAAGDPVNFSDPFGLCPPPVIPVCAVMLGFAVFGGSRIAINAVTKRPLDENVQRDAGLGMFAGLGAAGLAAAPVAAADVTATAVAASPAAAKLTVQFGRVANQVNHAFRHTDELGLNRETVKAAVQQNLQTVASQLTPGTPFNRVIEVEGVRLQYTGYQLANGVVNVGRIHAVTVP